MWGGVVLMPVLVLCDVDVTSQACAETVRTVNVPQSTFQSTNALDACRQLDLALRRHQLEDVW